MTSLYAPPQSRPGKSRLFRGNEDAINFSEWRRYVTVTSLTLELSEFDIGSKELQASHMIALWELGLKAFDREFSQILVWGFHSHTGDPQFNAVLAEQRAQNAILKFHFFAQLDARISKWGYKGVPWTPDMKDGERGDMRKVVILLRGITANPRDSEQPLGFRMKNR